MLLITVDMVMAFEPCDGWTQERVAGLIGEGKSPTELAEILHGIDPSGARWLLVRLLGPRRAEWACRCAERVLPIWEAYTLTDRRPHEAIAAARAGAGAAAGAAADTAAEKRWQIEEACGMLSE